MSKVIDVAGRIPKLPTFEELDRTASAEEAYAEEMDAEEFNPAVLKDRALAVSGAMSSLDYIVSECGGITGKQFWSVYREGRSVYIGQAMRAHAIFADILAEYERLPEAERPAPWFIPRSGDRP